MEEEQQKRCAQDRDGKSRREVVTQPRLESQRCHPVQQRRLFEPGVAPETRCNPVTGSRHLAADRRVSRLVLLNESRGRKSVEQEEEYEGSGQEMFRGDAGQFSIMPASQSLPAAVWEEAYTKMGMPLGPYDDSDAMHGYRRAAVLRRILRFGR